MTFCARQQGNLWIHHLHLMRPNALVSGKVEFVIGTSSFLMLITLILVTSAQGEGDGPEYR